jgi:poly(3-hydroxybutyrate) depolymerase
MPFYTGWCMRRADPRLVTSAPLPYLFSLPRTAAPASGAWPLLCFLHGYDEGTPMPIRQALTRHGPLAAASSPRATAEFIVVAAQLPTRGDVWYRYADAVQEIVQQVRALHRADPQQTFLTGFSFGGNGAFDLALEQREFWAALWPVDPTRVPQADPERPVWLSSGAVSRHHAHAFTQRLHLGPPHGAEPEDRVYVDQGQDHVGTARLAYQDERIYRWLLSKRLSSPGA